MVKKKLVEQKTLNDDGEDLPKTYIFRLGSVGINGSKLIKDIRQLMSPHTAIKLKVGQNYKPFLTLYTPVYFFCNFQLLMISLFFFFLF